MRRLLSGSLDDRIGVAYVLVVNQVCSGLIRRCTYKYRLVNSFAWGATGPHEYCRLMCTYQAYQFFESCGRSQDSCEILALYDLRVEDGVLLADPRAIDHADTLVTDIYAEYLDVLAIHDRSDTRFGAMGPCGRDFTLLLYLGLSTLVKMVSKDPTVNNTYLNGFKYLDQDLRFLVSKCLGLLGF